MPLYDFRCKNKKCENVWEELCFYSEIAEVRCPKCKSKKVEQLIGVCAVKFKEPKDTSKWDNFSYRAGFNLEKAQNERRMAETEAKVKGVDGYRTIDDISSGEHFGPVK